MMFKLVRVFFFVLIVRLCCSIKCVNKTCLDIPLTDHLEAPLTAKLDISELNKQIVNLIEHEVKDAITNLVDNITNHRMISVEKKMTAEVHNSMALNVRGLNDTFEQLSSRLNDIFQRLSSRLEDKLEQQSARLKDTFEKLSSDLENKVVSLNQRFRQEMLNQSKKTALTIQEHVQKDTMSLNSSVQQLESHFSQIVTKMNEQELGMKTTSAGLLAKISETNRKVAVSSCVIDHRIHNSGDIVHFKDAKTTTGIQDISAFKSTGIFTCETEGLYLVMTTILAHDAKKVHFKIYKNSEEVVRVFDGSDTEEHSSTGVVALVLSKGDKVFVKTGVSFKIHGSRQSCITIIRME